MTDTPNQTAPTPNEMRECADIFPDCPEVRRCLDGAAAEIARLRAAIARHRENVWAAGEVKHPEDAELYEVLSS